MICVFFAVVRPDMGKYVDLLNDVSTANYERAVSCDVAKLVFDLVELPSSEDSVSMDTAVLAAVKGFVSTATDEEETVLKFVNL